MAKAFGRIIEDKHRSGAERWRIDCGVVQHLGRRLIIAGPINQRTGRPRPFHSRAHAEATLEDIRDDLRANGVESAVEPYLPRDKRRDLCENRIAVYLADFRLLVDADKRSPNTLRGLEKYAAADGHWSWWHGRSIREIEHRDVKDWHAWLAERGIGLKTQKNVSDAFRSVIIASNRDESKSNRFDLPEFPAIDVPDYTARTIDPALLLDVIAAVPWERRGVFLVMAFEQVRVSEAVAFTLDDWDGEQLHIHRGRQGRKVSSRVRHGKNRSAKRRAPWWPELADWLEWRMEQVRPEDRLAGKATALFWNPGAYNTQKSWAETRLKEAWYRACDAAGVSISLQQGTRHTVLSRLAEVLPQAMLQDQSRHRDGRSLRHYTVGAKPDTAAMVRSIRPQTVRKEEDGS